MDFRLSEADRVLIEHMREFGVKYFNQDTVAQWRSDMGLPDEVVRDFVNLDFNGFGVIHRRDHVRYDMLAQVLVLEELSRISGTTLPFQNDFLQLHSARTMIPTKEPQTQPKIVTQHHSISILTYYCAKIALCRSRESVVLDTKFTNDKACQGYLPNRS